MTLPATAIYSRSGAVTDQGFTALGKFNRTTRARLKVSTTSDLLKAPVYSSWILVTAEGYAKVDMTGLDANTLYYYGWELNTVGNLSRDASGRCKTVGSGAHSFNFCHAACAYPNNSTSGVFTRIRNRNPAVLVMCGDMHYSDTASTDPALYRANWDNCMNVSVQKTLYSEIPHAYIWSDHDFCGNDSWSGSVGATTATLAYRQVMPHYPLAIATDTEGIYHTFSIGRVRFIMLDMRRYRSHPGATDDASKTMLGAPQKQWLKDLLMAHPNQMKFMVMDGPWIGSPIAGVLDLEDWWCAYTTERKEIANYVIANSIRNLVILAGDAHMVAIDNGTNSPGGIPLFQAAPIEQRASQKGGPYTTGPIPASGTATVCQYGYTQVTDTGGDLEQEADADEHQRDYE
jgi:phosphodiesterase/alkaline phosphatase D-like protein